MKFPAFISGQSTRLFFSLFLSLFPIVGCVAMGTTSSGDGRIDHSIEIFNGGKTEIIDVVYSYGILGPRPIKRLGPAGGGVTMPMPIPDVVDVIWTTETDGKRHEVHVPLKSKLLTSEVEGKIVSFEIIGATLKVFLTKRLADFRREKALVYESE